MAMMTVAIQVATAIDISKDIFSIDPPSLAIPLAVAEPHAMAVPRPLAAAIA